LVPRIRHENHLIVKTNLQNKEAELNTKIKSLQDQEKNLLNYEEQVKLLDQDLKKANHALSSTQEDLKIKIQLIEEKETGLRDLSHNIQNLEKELNHTLTTFSNVWLGNSSWIGGKSEPSIADLFAYHEIAQLDLVHYSFDNFPAIKAWSQRVKAIPHHNEYYQLISTNIPAKL